MGADAIHRFFREEYRRSQIFDLLHKPLHIFCTIIDKQFWIISELVEVKQGKKG